MNKERIIRIFYKYGLKAGIAFGAFVLIVLIAYFLLKRQKRLKKKKALESKIDLKDLFSNH